MLLLVFQVGNGEVYAQFTTFGSATGSCDCYELTKAETGGEAGSIWSPQKINLNNSFDFKFRIYLGDVDSEGADGMVFVLRQTGGDPGTSGGSIGYGDILNSIGVEVDTWSNEVNDDIIPDHLALNSNGNLMHDLVAPIAIPNIEDGEWHDFQVTWDPDAFSLSVSLDGINTLNYTGDLVSLVFGGDPEVYFGWTAGTGFFSNSQRVCVYRSLDFDVLNTDVCVDEVIDYTQATSSDLIYNEIEITDWFWNFGDGTTSTEENPVFAYASPGIYDLTLSVGDISGCTLSETFTIEVSPLPITVNFAHPTCDNSNDGVIEIITDGGVAPFTFEIKNWIGEVMNPDGDNIISTLDNGTYFILVEDATGCKGVDTVLLRGPYILFSVSDELKCAPYEALFIQQSYIIGDATFLWDFGDGSTSTEEFPTHVYKEPGVYDVTLVITSPGCIMTLERLGFIVVHPSPISQFTISSEREDLYHANFLFSDESIGAVEKKFYFDDGFSSEETQVLHNYTEASTYYPWQIVINEFGCQDKSIGRLVVIPVIPILIPNAFTPDGDQYNNVFQPILYESAVITMEIYNRWGQLIFLNTARDAYWDGAYSSGSLVEDGIYIYRVTYTDFLSKNPVEVNGHVSVIK